MASKYLEEDDSLVRYVPWGKLRKDEDDNVLGVLGEAFQLREGEEYLSVTWCQYFDGGHPGDLRCAVEAIRLSELDVRPKGHFAVAAKSDVAGHISSRKLRFIHEPADDNPAHVAIRGWSNDDLELLERLAEEVWNTLHSKAQIDALSLGQCAVSVRGSAKA